MGFILFSNIGMFAYNHKRKKNDIILREMYSDTLDMVLSFDVPVRRSALFSVNKFDVPVRPMGAKVLNVSWHYSPKKKGDVTDILWH